MITPANVFYVVWWFDQFGGMERHVTDMSIALAARGVKVTVFSETPLPLANCFGQELRAAGIEVVAPVAGRDFRKGFRLWRSAGNADQQHSSQMQQLLRAMTRHARKIKPDIVHVHGCRLGQSYVLQWAAANGYPAVYTEHVTIGDWGGPFDAQAPAIVARDADAICCVSAYSRASLADCLPLPREIAVVHHIIDDPGRSGHARPLRLSQPVSMLAVGRLAPHKGFAILLEALAQLRREGIAFHLRIAGDGEDRAALEGLRDGLGLADAVTFLGQVDHDAVSGLWQAAEIGVMPSLTEGLPLAIVEAMAAGKPLVASRVGGIPEVLTHDANGLLVEPGDTVALAAALTRLISEPGLATRLADAARHSFETGGWSEAAVAAQVLALYDLAMHSQETKYAHLPDSARWAVELTAEAAPSIECVAMFIWGLPPFGDMEALITTQACALSQGGIAVTVFVEQPVRPFNRYLGDLRRAGVRVVAPSLLGAIAHRGWMRLRSMAAPHVARSFTRELARRQPDVIHVHGWQLGLGWLKPVLQRAAERGIHIVYTEHASQADGIAPATANTALVALVNRLSAVSPAAAALLVKAAPSRPVQTLRYTGKSESLSAQSAGSADASSHLRVFALLPPLERAALARDLTAMPLQLDPPAPITGPWSSIDDCDLVVLSPELPGFVRLLIEAIASLKPVVICGDPNTSPIRHRANGLVVAKRPASALLELAGDPLLAWQLAIAAHRAYEAMAWGSLAVLSETLGLYRLGADGNANC